MGLKFHFRVALSTTRDLSCIHDFSKEHRNAPEQAFESVEMYEFYPHARLHKIFTQFKILDKFYPISNILNYVHRYKYYV